MAPEPNRFTYVDRGDLDREVKLARTAGKHVAIHGQSKLGKSWLRARVLTKRKVARIQCLPGMTAAAVIEQALGGLGIEETISVTVEKYQDQEGAAGAHVPFGPATLNFKRGESSGKKRAWLRRPVGTGADSLGWVAAKFRSKRRTPVFEDFHNLPKDEQFAMSYVIKALGEWEVPCVVVGIWTDTHLLKLYNGELDGRVVDVPLKWEFDDLREVVHRGCKALNVELSDQMIDALVRSAYTSVGLLQELCAATLHAAGIERRGLRARKLDDMDAVKRGTDRVISQITSRFEPFVQKLGEVDAGEGHPSFYADLVSAVENRLGESALLEGVDVDELLTVMIFADPELERSTLVTFLARLDEVQRAAGINPSVLAYDDPRERFILVDRRLLLYLSGGPAG
jgi:hypothetical protein